MCGNSSNSERPPDEQGGGTASVVKSNKGPDKDKEKAKIGNIHTKPKKGID